MLRLIRSISTLFIALVVAATSSTLASAVERSTYLVMPNPGAVSEVRSLISSLGEYPEEQLQLLDDLFVVDLLPEAAQSLAASSAVAYIEQDSPVSLTAVQEPAPSWGQDRIDGALDGKYNFPSQSGEGVIAYVFDTGVAADHPDLAGRVSQGFDVIGNNQANTDCHFHGTHVAGTIGGTQFGLAKKVSIVPLRVLDCNGSGSIVGVMRAINWTIANHPTGTPAVANFSLGGGRNLSFNNAISALVDKGITTVVAAGNERTDACTRSPASALDAITVGSTDRFDNRSSFSNFGECVDVFAPGSGILSANAKNYTTPIALSGTSMASPHVAGVAALILGTSPSALPEQVASVITDLSQKGIVNGSNTIVGNRLANVPSESAVPIPSLPGAPTGLQVVNSGKGFVSFGWDAVAGAASYQVEYRKASQNTALISSVNTTSFTVTGLSGGEVAYLRVRAVVDGSTTRFSSIVSGRSVVEIASEPREVQVSALSKNSAIISWSLPSYLGGASTLTYRVEMKTTGEWMPIGSGPSSNVQLSNMNVPHQFRVFAVNEAGVSAPSAIATFDPALVYQVQTMSAIIQGGSNLDLSWLSDAPAGTKFEVSLSQLYRSNTTQTVIVEGNQHRFTGLIRMTAYRIQVTPIGSIRGVGLTQQLVTSAVTPSAPRFISTVRTDAGWQLRFSAPTDNGGVPVVTHRLEALVDG
ncbi:MAG: hypothetical protein EBS38_06695, partial [Actinobacteria bacterium]|nr:hypothetical protein [Actinomycetota bacterium]